MYDANPQPAQGGSAPAFALMKNSMIQFKLFDVIHMGSIFTLKDREFKYTFTAAFSQISCIFHEARAH